MQKEKENSVLVAIEGLLKAEDERVEEERQKAKEQRRKEEEERKKREAEEARQKRIKEELQKRDREASKRIETLEAELKAVQAEREAMREALIAGSRDFKPRYHKRRMVLTLGLPVSLLIVLFSIFVVFNFRFEDLPAEKITPVVESHTPDVGLMPVIKPAEILPEQPLEELRPTSAPAVKTVVSKPPKTRNVGRVKNRGNKTPKQDPSKGSIFETFHECGDDPMCGGLNKAGSKSLTD